MGTKYVTMAIAKKQHEQSKISAVPLASLPTCSSVGEARTPQDIFQGADSHADCKQSIYKRSEEECPSDACCPEGKVG